MNYQTYEPDKELSSFIKCYWILESSNQEYPQKQTIVPDGCMEMIFHNGDLYKQYTERGKFIVQPRCFVFGQLTRLLEIEPTGVTGIFSVRFLPGGFSPFTNIDLKEMENSAISIKHLFKKDGEELAHSILQAKSISEKIRLVETFFKSRLSYVDTIDRIIKSTVETILTANGQITVNELSQYSNINRRQLERKFSSAIGLSPKQLSKTIRLQATLKWLLTNPFTSLTALAYQGEYYDQSHFIRDFKELTGLTPKEFYGDTLAMSRFFIG